jgi:hypothetical protein
METSLIQMDLHIKESGRMGRKMERAKLFTQMESIKMEFGKTINLSQEKSTLHMRMVISIRADG